MTKSYQKLCTEFYDLDKPEAGPAEIRFYSDLLKDRKGPFLEAMCGSGRLLIPLLKEGYQIDGIDNSTEMLDSCSLRCKNHGLEVNLFNQSLQNLNLPNKYDVIFIAIGSFQLIEDRTQASIVLTKLHENLLPGGILVLETFIPWDNIKECIHGYTLQDKTFVSFEKKVSFPNGFIVHKGKSTISPIEQIEFSTSQYEKVVNQEVVAIENEQLAVRWYYRYEMELFLEKVGFGDIQIYDASFEQNPQAIVYQGRKA